MLPGTTTIDGYSEEYRSYQLLLRPAVNITYRATLGFPNATLSNIIFRLQRISATSAEENYGLLPFLGLSPLDTINFGFGPNGTLKQRIDSLCDMLNRSLVDEPTRFRNFAKIRNFSSVLLAEQYNETELQNLLFQILIGAELLKRLAMQPAGVSYGSITDNISGMIVAADLFMSNVKSSVSIQSARYKFHPINCPSQAHGLLKFAEAIDWPLLTVAKRNLLESVMPDIGDGKTPDGFDLCDWLYGLVPPGKTFSHRIMSALVEATPGVRYWVGAPHCENGISVQGKSYWPQRTVLGRVLGGLTGVKSTCGWIGPLPAPTETDSQGKVITGWIRLHERQVATPIPLPRATDPLAAFGSAQDDDTETRRHLLDAVASPDNHAAPTPPRRPADHFGSLLRGITLAPATAGTDPSADPHLPTLEFHIAGLPVRYTLHYSPVFVSAPPCVGGPHAAFAPLAWRLLPGAVPVARLKDAHPPAAGSLPLVVSAVGATTRRSRARGAPSAGATPL